MKSFFYNSKKTPRRAFTLVEVMLGLAISALVMFGCVALMFDMARLTEYFESGNSFRNHVDGVEKFLRCAVVDSEIGSAAKFESPLTKNTAGTIYVAKDFENTGANDYYIGYGVRTSHPFYPSPLGFGADKICLLELDGDDGLYLVWKFTDAEIENSDPAIYKTLLSKWVKKIGYIYNSSAGWEEEETLRTSGETLMPSYIKIYFDKNGETYERIISLDVVLDFQISN